MLRIARINSGLSGGASPLSRAVICSQRSLTTESASMASARRNRRAISGVNVSANRAWDARSRPSCSNVSCDVLSSGGLGEPTDQLTIMDARIVSARSPSWPTINTFWPPDRRNSTHIGAAIATGSPIHTGRVSTKCRVASGVLESHALSGLQSSRLGATLPSKTIMRLSEF